VRGMCVGALIGVELRSEPRRQPRDAGYIDGAVANRPVGVGVSSPLQPVWCVHPLMMMRAQSLVVVVVVRRRRQW
jgi:hypothetical protein